MTRLCVPAACSPHIAKVAGGCNSCGAETAICCLKVTHSAWAHPRFLRATSYAIGDPCTDATKTNWCGEWYTPNLLPGVDCDVVKDCCMPWVRIAVETRASCDLYMQVEYLDSVNGEHVSFIVQPASTWHSAAYTVTIPGTADTLTIEVCEETDVIFPDENDPVALRAALWFLVDGVWSPYIAGDPETPPPNQVYAAATGNSMCVLAGCADANENHTIAFFTWEYDIRTDEVVVRITSTDYGVAEIRVAWDSAGAWADTLTTIPVDAPFIPAWATDAEWRVAKITDCDDPTDPGDECDPYLCYPLCVVNTCPDDPESINASAVFITANDGVDEYTGTATWSDITSEYTFSFDVGPSCGTLSGRVYCDGADIKVDFDLFDGAVHTYATFTVTWNCVDGDVSWTTTTPVSGITCALDITLWTNNGGA